MKDFTNKIQAIKAVREAAKVSTYMASVHCHDTLRGGDKTGYVSAIGLKEAKELTEAVMAYGVRRYQEDQAKAACENEPIGEPYCPKVDPHISTWSEGVGFLNETRVHRTEQIVGRNELTLSVVRAEVLALTERVTDLEQDQAADAKDLTEAFTDVKSLRERMLAVETRLEGHLNRA